MILRSIATWLCGLVLLLLLPGCRPLLTVDDAVAMDGDPVRLTAYVEREHLLGLRSDLKKVPVTFYAGHKQLGRKSTGEHGRAVLAARLPPGQSEFEARAMVGPLPLKDTGRVFHWNKARVIIAVDIDYTISKTEYRKLVLLEAVKVSSPVKDSREVLQALAKNYYIVYLTARPRFLLDKTHKWLEAYDFPAGPVVAAPRLRDAIWSLEYKKRTLEMLKEEWPALLIGIGNRKADIEAYAVNSMLPIMVCTDDDGDDEYKPVAGAVVAQDWRGVRRFFEANGAILADPRGIRNVVKGEQLLQQPLNSWHKVSGDD